MTLRFGLLAFPQVQQLDLTGPYEVFASVPGSEVHLIWKDLQPLRSATGLMLTPTVTFADCPPLDVLCVPGGAGVNALLEDETVLAFLRERGVRPSLSHIGLHRLAGARARPDFCAANAPPRIGTRSTS